MRSLWCVKSVFSRAETLRPRHLVTLVSAMSDTEFISEELGLVTLGTVLSAEDGVTACSAVQKRFLRAFAFTVSVAVWHVPPLFYMTATPKENNVHCRAPVEG